jgi:hypothetical protein
MSRLERAEARTTYLGRQRSIEHVPQTYTTGARPSRAGAPKDAPQASEDMADVFRRV